MEHFKLIPKKDLSIFLGIKLYEDDYINYGLFLNSICTIY